MVQAADLTLGQVSDGLLHSGKVNMYACRREATWRPEMAVLDAGTRARMRGGMRK
jgi:hypothetical protein